MTTQSAPIASIRHNKTGQAWSIEGVQLFFSVKIYFKKCFSKDWPTFASLQNMCCDWNSGFAMLHYFFYRNSRDVLWK
ncbi:hypothetical protein J4Q44_G00085670 [Coregonus suidteri]|uniref:Uncharacterized protein n=1 Tax=Coregonus suidteri TaxID=861788 RepID=A0AAN8R237_9TELE